jgi:hypothetical protein
MNGGEDEREKTADKEEIPLSIPFIVSPKKFGSVIVFVFFIFIKV